ncbi:hypothetical protein [Methylocella sp.]|uniref:hypothetical protein n=1 Tax=Methylocella sp. TaxID=1978226 RepID=UPI00378306B1
MTVLTYKIVEHDGGFAYKVGDVYSETFRTHDEALAAARLAAAEQRAPGDPEEIEYETEAGQWRVEHAAGDDRPDTEVLDGDAQAGGAQAGDVQAGDA